MFPRRLLHSAVIEAADAVALVELARAIKRGRKPVPTRLHGRNIALLATDAAAASTRRFDAAATALGARVAHLEPAPGWLAAATPIEPQAARLFESLYDAVDCEGLPHEFAQRLQTQVGLPVYDGLAHEDHPIFQLLPRVADDAAAPRDEDRHALLQAALLGTLG